MKGRKIVLRVMAECRLGEHDFFVSRLNEHVRARKIAFDRLHSAGLNKREIGYVMRRDPATVDYWVRSERRDRAKLTYLARRAAA